MSCRWCIPADVATSESLKKYRHSGVGTVDTHHYLLSAAIDDCCFALE